MKSDVTLDGLCKHKQVSGANTSGRVGVAGYVPGDLRMLKAMNTRRGHRKVK